MRILCSFAVVWLLLSAWSSTASADCSQQTRAIDRIICSDQELTALESDLVRAYDDARKRVAAQDLPFLGNGAAGWLSTGAIYCSREMHPDWTDDGVRACLRNDGLRLLEYLKNWPGRGHAQMLAAGTLEETACAAALDRANIAWEEWPEGEYRPHPSVPKDAREPAWSNVEHAPFFRFARFDILNAGVARDVYSIESDRESYGEKYHWYIVVADGEEAAIRERVAHAGSLTALAADLQIVPIADYANGAWREIFGPQRKPASLKSLLIDASNSDFYRGHYAESRAFAIAGVAYIMAIGDDGVAALLRPDKDGSLQALCRHVVIPPRTEHKIEVTDAAFPCPEGIGAKPVGWQGTEFNNSSASVALEQWGGARMVTRHIASSGAHYTNLRLLAGPVGDSAPPIENHWQPLDEINGHFDDVGVRLTDAGAYIVATNSIPLGRPGFPLGTTYYRIVDDGLKPVCRVTNETILPPGYAVRN